ncbi:MAG: hypothetical protein NT118_13155 [Lentisphaerae bacterium]|nr:hypothetical protein [Lentisphaerota bacterium]
MYDDIAPLVMAPILNSKFDLLCEFGIDPEPLFGFNSASAARELFDVAFGLPIGKTLERLPSIIESLNEIESNRLLGKHTSSKMCFVKSITGCTLRKLSASVLGKNRECPRTLLGRVIELLNKNAFRLPDRHFKIIDIQSLIMRVRNLFSLFELYNQFSAHSYFQQNADGFFSVYADWIVQSIVTSGASVECEPSSHRQRLHVLMKNGIEATFLPRNTEFVFSGDRYGDCTAFHVRSQVDQDIANIHWTIYSWLLDPYYRVMEVLLDGRPALKCHILPLIIQNRPLLMVDAIEVVPQLRERKDGSSNPTIDPVLHKQRHILLDALFEVCKTLASRMGLEVVYVEKFSNARWVRDVLEDLPADSYHIRDVNKPYSKQIIQEITRDLIHRKPRLIHEEIQATNTRLMHQHGRCGYKEVGVLMGLRKNWHLEIVGP